MIDTGSLLACIAAFESLSVLEELYEEVLVPREVAEEIMAGGAASFGLLEFNEASRLTRWPVPVTPVPMLARALGKGEAAVIQLALNRRIEHVCIDEAVGRRLARLCGLTVFGSVAIVLRARREGRISSVRAAIARMQARGIWLGESVISFALRESGEA